MTDNYAALEAAARAATQEPDGFFTREFRDAASPDTILALLAERRALREALMKCSPGNGAGESVCMGDAVGRAASCGLGSSHTPHLYSAALNSEVTPNE